MNLRHITLLASTFFLLFLLACNPYKGGNFYKYYTKPKDYDPNQAHSFVHMQHTIWFNPHTPLLIGLAPDTIKVKGSDGKERDAIMDAIYLANSEVTNSNFAFFLNEYTGKNIDSIKVAEQYISLGAEGCQITKSGGVYQVNEAAKFLPVVQVSKAGANAYCNWMTSKYWAYRDSIGLFRLGEFRLPSYDEMTVALHTGKVWVKEKNSKKEQEYTNLDRAWVKVNSGGKIHKAGENKPDYNGIYDLDGNLKEWVYDSYMPGERIDWTDTDTNDIHAGSDFTSELSPVNGPVYTSVTKGATFSNVGFRVCLNMVDRSLSEF